MTFSIPANIRPHWNYFLALEKDLEATSRYVEFSTANLDTYSIEFAHLLLSSASRLQSAFVRYFNLMQRRTTLKNIGRLLKKAKKMKTWVLILLVNGPT